MLNAPHPSAGPHARGGVSLGVFRNRNSLNIRYFGRPAVEDELDGQRLTKAAAGDQAGERQIAAQIGRFIDAGRWLLPRGPAELYRDAAGREPKPESWLLAEALARVWEAEGKGRISASSLRVIEVCRRRGN